MSKYISNYAGNFSETEPQGLEPYKIYHDYFHPFRQKQIKQIEELQKKAEQLEQLSYDPLFKKKDRPGTLSDKSGSLDDRPGSLNDKSGSLDDRSGSFDPWDDLYKKIHTQKIVFEQSPTDKDTQKIAFEKDDDDQKIPSHILDEPASFDKSIQEFPQTGFEMTDMSGKIPDLRLW